MLNRVVSLVLVALVSSSFSGAAVAAEQQDSRKPLMVVRFNQEHVYYNRALKQAVTNAEAAKPGVRYEVVSVVPTDAKKGKIKPSAERAKENLAGVTTGLQQLGVDAARIRSSSQTASAVNSQEVRIYVE